MAGLWQMVFRQLQPQKKRVIPQNVRHLDRKKPEESGQMNKQEQERTQKDVENEDLLISQIDEFREKAKQPDPRNLSGQGPSILLPQERSAA